MGDRGDHPLAEEDQPARRRQALDALPAGMPRRRKSRAIANRFSAGTKVQANFFAALPRYRPLLSRVMGRQAGLVPRPPWDALRRSAADRLQSGPPAEA